MRMNDKRWLAASLVAAIKQLESELSTPLERSNFAHLQVMHWSHPCRVKEPVAALYITVYSILQLKYSREAAFQAFHTFY